MLVCYNKRNNLKRDNKSRENSIVVIVVVVELVLYITNGAG